MYRCVLVWVTRFVCHCVCLYTYLVIVHFRTIVFHLYSFSLYVTFCLAKFLSHSPCSFLSQMLLIPTDFFWILVKPKFQIYFYKRNIDNVCVYMILLCFWQCVRVSYCLYVYSYVDMLIKIIEWFLRVFMSSGLDYPYVINLISKFLWYNKWSEVRIQI